MNGETSKRRAKAEAALAALNIGKDFAAVAAGHSRTPYSDAGNWVEAGKDDPLLVEQALALSGEGDLSSVFRTQACYYILRLRQSQSAHAPLTLGPLTTSPDTLAGRCRAIASKFGCMIFPAVLGYSASGSSRFAAMANANHRKMLGRERVRTQDAIALPGDGIDDRHNLR